MMYEFNLSRKYKSRHETASQQAVIALEFVGSLVSIYNNYEGYQKDVPIEYRVNRGFFVVPMTDSFHDGCCIIGALFLSSKDVLCDLRET